MTHMYASAPQSFRSHSSSSHSLRLAEYSQPVSSQIADAAIVNQHHTCPGTIDNTIVAIAFWLQCFVERVEVSQFFLFRLNTVSLWGIRTRL